MINTIFYFAPDLSLTDYQALVDQDNGIAARTIVFASAQKAIYKGGQQYSVGDISSDISSYLTTNKYLKEGDQYFARFLTQQNLDGYLTSADLLPYALTSSLNSYALKSDLNEFYNNASYSNGILTLTKKGGDRTPITINTALGQLLTSLNSMNNPTAQDTNKTLVWNGNSWTYGTSSGGTTYNAGSGIVINNNTISLKTSTSLTGLNGDRNYPVQTDSNGVPYVNVNWFSNTTQGNYVVNISPDTILVPTDSDGTGTIGNTTCHVTVSLNGQDVPIDQNGIVVGTITRSDNNAVGNTITALPSGNTIIVSVTNATSFAKKTAQIPVDIYVGGVNISTQYIQLTGMTKAPVSGADAISLWTSVEIVHLSYDRSAISVNEISVGMLRGNSRMSNSETQTAGYSIWYKFSEQQTYTLLPSSLSSKSISTNEELTSSSVTFVLCYGTDTTFLNPVITKQIPFVVDPAPAIGTPQYQINILSNSIQYKEGETNYSGTIQFQLLKDGIALTGQEPTENSQTLGYFKIYCGNSTTPVWNQTPNQSAVSTYSLSTDQNNYTYSITISGQNPDIYYTSVQFINGATILASTVVPFIVEGANGTTTTQIQPLSGVVTRIIDILDDAPFTSSADVYDEQGATNGSNVVNHGTWYAGDVPDNNGITYLDILHYRTRTGNENDGYTYVDHGYFRPRTTNSHIAPVIVYNDGTTSSTYINYTVHGAVVNGGNYYTNHSTLLTIEWEVFNTMPDSVFNHMLANSAYIQNLTVAKDLVITDGERNPTAGITGTSSTINTANGGTVTTGQGDIRIWAGYPTNNSLYNCPFYVTNTGHLHASDAEISGTVNATSGNFENITIKNSFVLPKIVSVNHTDYTNHGVYAFQTKRDNNGPLIDGSDNRYSFVTDYDTWIETGTFSGTPTTSDFTVYLPPAEYAKGRVFEFIFSFRRESTYDKMSVPLKFVVGNAAIAPTVQGENTTPSVDVDETYWERKHSDVYGWLNLFTTVTTVYKLDNGSAVEVPIGNKEYLELKDYEKIRIASMVNPYSGRAIDNDHENRPHYSWVLLSAD